MASTALCALHTSVCVCVCVCMCMCMCVCDGGGGGEFKQVLPDFLLRMVNTGINSIC